MSMYIYKKYGEIQNKFKHINLKTCFYYISSLKYVINAR